MQRLLRKKHHSFRFKYSWHAFVEMDHSQQELTHVELYYFMGGT